MDTADFRPKIDDSQTSDPPSAGRKRAKGGKAPNSGKRVKNERAKPRPQTMGIELSVVIPTFNEKENIRPIIEALGKALQGISWEAIFVDDDSPDGTADAVRQLSTKYPNIRCVQRIGRRGLSSACVEGMYVSSAPYLAVMDADLQHDETILTKMLAILKKDELDVVVGSRYVEGGGTGDWQQSRVRLGALATKAGKLVMRATVQDPMSGFFVLDRALLERAARRMSGKGYKILMDLFMSSEKPVRFVEVPYKMRARSHGVSKLDLVVAWEFFSLIADKLIGRFIPLRFVMFVVVGMVGALVHLAILGTLTQAFHYTFALGQSTATVVAMTTNFFLNNILTYRDRRLRGWRLIWGLGSFYVACGLGALINVVLAQFLFNNGIVWWISGLLGALVGAVWNFAITSSFTWRQQARRDPPGATDSPKA